jgi:hypothetical protein
MWREEYRLRVFENRMLRRMYEPKRDEIIDGLRKLHYKELHTLYFLPVSMRITKSWIGWARNVAQLERRTVHTKFWGEILKRRNHWEDLDLMGG